MRQQAKCSDVAVRGRQVGLDQKSSILATFFSHQPETSQSGKSLPAVISFWLSPAKHCSLTSRDSKRKLCNNNNRKVSSSVFVSSSKYAYFLWLLITTINFTVHMIMIQKTNIEPIKWSRPDLNELFLVQIVCDEIVCTRSRWLIAIGKMTHAIILHCRSSKSLCLTPYIYMKQGCLISW